MTSILSISELQEFEPNASSRPRVAIFLPNLDRGGAENFAVNLANGLTEDGVDVDVITFVGSGELISNCRDQVRVISLNTRFPPLVVARLIIFAHRVKPRAMFSLMPRANALLGLAKYFGRFPFKTIGSERSDESPVLGHYERLIERIGSPVLRFGYRKLDGMSCVSSVIKDRLSVKGLQKPEFIQVIPNPLMPPNANVELAHQSSHSHLDSQPSGPVRLVSVGRLVEQKGFEYLIQAMPLILRRKPAHLTIVGSGPLYSSLNKLADRLEVEEHVTFVSARSDISGFYRNADIYVHAAIYEGFGNVVLEALSWYLPVISTDCPGPSSILIDGRLGDMVPRRDAHALAEAILRHSPPKPQSVIDEYLSFNYSKTKIIGSYKQLLGL